MIFAFAVAVAADSDYPLVVHFVVFVVVTVSVDLPQLSQSPGFLYVHLLVSTLHLLQIDLIIDD